jgi:CrcB protein
MIKVLAVGAGGFIGASLRYLISLFCVKNIKTFFPVATLFVNVIGAVLIGFIMEYTSNSRSVNDNVKLFITTGFLGGLTTFSTFSYETLALIEKGNYLAGGMNALLNLVLSLIGAYAGILLARVIKPV